MQKTLPPKYYLTHFHEFLRFFEGANNALLTDEARTFIQAFHRLCENKQCVIARAANRKYAIIDRSHFNYPEIDAPQTHIDELIEAKYFIGLEHASIGDIQSTLTKNALIEYLSLSNVEVKKSVSKQALSEQLRRYYPTIQWPSVNESQYLTQGFNNTLRYLLFLYFGNTKGRLNQFSLRDLGVMKTRGEVSGRLTRFETEQEAAGAWHFVCCRETLTHALPNQLVILANRDYPNVESAEAVAYRDRYFLTLGERLLHNEPALALQTLRRCESDAGTERWCREAFKAGCKDEVKQALERIIDSPQSDTLLAFAEDFYRRKFHQKRTSVLTDMLRNASQTLRLDESQRHQVERGVMALYKRNGLACWRSENHLWRALFGLTFWPLLFSKGAMVTEFDRRPLSLRNNTFYNDCSNEIDNLLKSLTSRKSLQAHLAKMAATHYGKPNSLFLWKQSVLDLPMVLVEHASLESIKFMLLAMCKDFKTLSDGFPDIMTLQQGVLRFEEIKAPGDQLRRNQLVSIQRLQQAGFDVSITQVEWVRDPNQPYAVVDIETTGGNHAYHRITEVGIVKLQNGQVIGRFQSLVNPQRNIPQSITRLTGISNDMVADAPVFEALADSIEAFVEGCVFVAHNVNFDYGFIKQEFARLERNFRMPKICTVREMRRAVPGLKSYSLAALTAHFDIAMAQHHRALSDANAAAELLKIIHQVDEQKA